MSDGADKTAFETANSRGDVAPADLDAPATLLDDNPFADVPHTEPVSRDEKPVILPACFASIASQLPPQVAAKLKSVDCTTADVVLTAETGQKSEPRKLAFFMLRDFARSCAARLGCAGIIWVDVVEPGKAAWGFAFDADAAGGAGAAVAGGGGDPDSPVIAELRRMRADFDRKLDDVRMEASLGGGGGSPLKLLKELKECGLIGNQQQGGGGNDIAQLALALKALNEVSAQTQVSAINQLIESRKLTDSLGMGKPPEKTTSQEFKEILEIGPVKTLVEAGTKAMVQSLMQRGAASGPEAPATAVDDNPFANMEDTDAA